MTPPSCQPRAHSCEARGEGKWHVDITRLIALLLFCENLSLRVLHFTRSFVLYIRHLKKLTLNQEFLTKVFTDWRGRLRSVASAIAGREDADDVVSEAFFRLWSRKEEVRNEREAIRLGYAAVRNGAIDSLRRAQTHPSVGIEEADYAARLSDVADEQRDRIETYEAVLSLSRKILNERQLKVFTLHDVEGRGYDEVASMLGMTEANVRMVLSRARRQIRLYYNSTLP